MQNRLLIDLTMKLLYFTIQMNIAKWDDETLRLWNTPCRTPAYSKE